MLLDKPSIPITYGMFCLIPSSSPVLAFWVKSADFFHRFWITCHIIASSARCLLETLHFTALIQSRLVRHKWNFYRNLRKVRAESLATFFSYCAPDHVCYVIPLIKVLCRRDHTATSNLIKILFVCQRLCVLMLMCGWNGKFEKMRLILWNYRSLLKFLLEVK